MRKAMSRIMLAVSAGEWEGIQHRPHHFMRRSAKSGWTVLYLEPPATLISPLKNSKMLTRWKNWRQGLREVEPNIYLLAPPPILPFANKYRRINKINQWLISRTVKKSLRSLKTSTVDVYSFLPSAIDLLPFIKADKVIYDCVDDHSSFSGLINREVVLQMEQELAQRAQVNFATARQLISERQAWSPSFYLIPNGAEFEHFASVDDQTPIPEELVQIPRPIAGFIGGISDWIDLDLLAKVAQALPEVSFVFIGPVATNVDNLRQLPNVFLLGARPYKQLPVYLREFATCLIPFKINKLTEAVNPIKMYEYLAAGKPVVSTPLPEVLAYREVVEIAASAPEMVSALQKTLSVSANDEEARRKRQSVGKANSWDARWQTAVEYILQEAK